MKEKINQLLNSKQANIIKKYIEVDFWIYRIKIFKTIKNHDKNHDFNILFKLNFIISY